MGMSSHVIGLREEDQQYLTNMRALQALRDAKVETLPKELAAYFGCEDLEDVELGEILEVDIGPAKNEYRSDYEDGYEVDLRKLPPGVVKLRFYNSY